MIYPYPYSDDELAGAAPVTAPGSPGRGRWALVSVIAGLAGAALALVPGGALGVVVAGVGIAAGIVALLRARPTAGGRFWAVTGVTASALAAAVTLLLAAARLPFAATAPPTAATAAVSSDVDSLLADELGVRFGGFTESSVFPELRVVLTNKRDEVRQCDVVVGAFSAPERQLGFGHVRQASSYSAIVLGPRAVAETTAEFMGLEDATEKLLRTADFRVITANCGPFGYRG